MLFCPFCSDLLSVIAQRDHLGEMFLQVSAEAKAAVDKLGAAGGDTSGGPGPSGAQVKSA